MHQCAAGRPDTEFGLRRLADAAERAAAGGAALLMLPEMFLTGYAIGAAAARDLAEPSDGPAAARAAAIARERGIALLYGHPELGADGSVYNAISLFGADGTRLAGHRKSHLFGDVDVSQFRPGDRLTPPVRLGDWQVGLAICYEIEFPEIARALALAGVTLLLTPTANMAPFEGICTRVVPARAEENSMFVAYANYVGREGPFDYCGLSCICAPDGTDLARAGADEAWLFADIERSRLDARRRLASHLADRRPELYAAFTEAGGGGER